ncbi:MAG: hypothetical protein WC657_07305 [Candidatus Paceibacterota bacterium]
MTVHDFWQVVIGIIVGVVVATYTFSPTMQEFVDGTWHGVRAKVHTTWTDFRNISVLSPQEMIAVENVRIKKACERGDQKACQYLKAVEGVER